MQGTLTSFDIILASTSPRRQQLLALADIAFTTLNVEVDETLKPGELPQDYIQRMVTIKANQACELIMTNHHTTAHFANRAGYTSANSTGQVGMSNNNKLTIHNVDAQSSLKLMITADTIGVLPDKVSILVKPVNKADAYSMWHKMSKKTHTIWTAVQLSLVNQYGKIVKSNTILEKTAVTFIALNEQDMDSYWQSGEPQDKAGAYAIQGKGAQWVSRIEGSYTNVVGLPLSQTIAAIKALTMH